MPSPPAITTEASTQTARPPVRSYAEAATSTTPPPPNQDSTRKDKGKQPTTGPNSSAPAKATATSANTTPVSTKRQPPPATPPPPRKLPATGANAIPVPKPKPRPAPRPAPPSEQSRTIVLHAAPTRYKPGEMRRWVEEDNKGVHILGIRWLLSDQRRVGKLASSLVIYMKTDLDTNKRVRMGRRTFRITRYDWER